MEQKPLKILLVEDDEDDAFYIKDLKMYAVLIKYHIFAGN